MLQLASRHRPPGCRFAPQRPSVRRTSAARFSCL